MQDYLTIVPNFAPNDGVSNPPQRAGNCAAVWHFFLAQTPEMHALSATKAWEAFNKAVPGQNLGNFKIEWPRARRWYNAERQKNLNSTQTQGVPKRAAGLADALAAAPAAVAAMQEKITAKKDGVCQRIWQYCHNEITAGRTPTVSEVAAACGRPPEMSTAHRQYLEYVDAAWAELEKLGVAPTPAGEQLADSDPCINRIYYGPPGTGKTYTLNGILRDYEERSCFVTFHQSYGYEEFVEGLRPVLKDEANAGEVQYEIRAGAFKELCERAREEPEQRFAMVIDEINRGNISKIFGELITLIEPDKREGTKNAVTVTLPYSGELFSVPANVDIFGTMNTADRSLALLDTALRRRFEFEELQPNASKLVKLTTDAGVIDVPKMLERINERIEVLYDREHCIGHAYFIGLKDFAALKTVFQKKILPLLEEYFFEDWHKIRLVLGDNQKQEAHQFVRDERQDLAELFGNDHGLDSYTTKRRYSVQEEAFNYPAAYIGIYQPAA